MQTSIEAITITFFRSKCPYYLQIRATQQVKEGTKSKLITFFPKKTLRSISFERSPYMQLIIFLLSDCFQVAKMFWHQEFIPLKNQILPREPSWISNDNQNLTTIRFPIFLKIKMATGSHLEFEFKT